MDFQNIDAPPEIIDCVRGLSDITIDGFSEKGGNGYVFFGFHNLLKRRVALKFYFYEGDANSEVELLAKIDHPNIMKVWDARTVGNGWAFFITSEVGIGDLDEHIGGRNVGLIEAINITRGILDGLGAMHNEPNNILHRDLKPANILLDAKGLPLIADFGSVKRLPDGGEYVSGSKHAALYRPPEAFEKDIYTYSSDLYQVGLVLYQLLGGHLPYDPLAWFNKVEMRRFKKLDDEFEKWQFIEEVLFKCSKKGQLTKLNTLPIYVPQRVKKIIRVATNPDITKRYQMTSEFLLDLHKLGEIPNWQIVDGYFFLHNWKARDYRVVPRKSQYVCEHKTCGKSQWRKNGNIDIGSEIDIVSQLIENCGIA
ncbi:MAG: hypothetical protein APF76_04590 [Desulfitibacter sp. BRH_c19]|nr:MAG: hypothetical protein APF76_04590 [Desulfitibacter sp. BRH_c19]